MRCTICGKQVDEVRLIVSIDEAGGLRSASFAPAGSLDEESGDFCHPNCFAGRFGSEKLEQAVQAWNAEAAGASAPHAPKRGHRRPPRQRFRKFDPSVGPYLWAEEEDDNLMALSVTWIRYDGPTVDILRAGGHSARQVAALTLADGWRFESEHELLLTGRLGAFAVLIAPNGYEYSLPEVAAGASRLGDLVTVFWNVEALMRVTVASDGRIVRSFDPLLYDRSDEALAEEAGLPFGEPAAPLRAASFALAERLTGVELAPSWLFQQHQAVIVDRVT